MSLYLSDKEANRTLVASIYKNQQGHYADPDFIDTCYKAPSVVVEAASNPHTRKEVLQYVVDSKDLLAAWKAIAKYEDWLLFLSQLQLNSLSVRDINLIKQIIDTEFKQQLEDYQRDYGDLSEKILIVTGVKSITTTQGSKGLTVRVEYL